ncbi:MAG: type IIA DNA topoisomerase subunit B [Bifidobacteriaceae bacterium]|nr:type IIA DNA topoisomerase subunit B [Bifidobacteriaceae bacterium]
MSVKAPEYSAHHLQVLEGLEAVRKRPGMYIGSTDARGLMHCAWEIIDNSVDEALAGFCDAIDVTLFPDGSVEVQDNGRGIPVDIEPKTGLSGVEVVFTKLHSGAKFGGAGSGYGAAGGLHGVGASVVNALSARLDAEVARGGKLHVMRFHRGEPGVYDDARGLGPDVPFTPFTDASLLEVGGRVRKGVTGTRVRFWPDPQIFPEPGAFSLEALGDRARQTSFLVPGLKLTVRDWRGAEPVEEVFQHAGGLTDYVEYLAPDQPIQSVWRIKGEDTFVETVQALDEDGHLRPTEVERTCEVEVALRWGTGYDPTVKSFVNIIATPKGGTHLQGFEQGLLKAIRAQVEANSRRLKTGGKTGGAERVEKDDVLAGLTAVLAVRLAEPQFEGQTKEVLGTGPVRGIVAKIVAKGLTKRLTSTKRDEKAESFLALEKIVAEMRARVAARTHKEISRRKNALETSSLPAKLADCRSSDVERSELFIVEGDSALGTAKLARQSDFQALLPIRGKILNTQKASITDMLKNAECAAIIQVIGAGSGRTFDLEQSRYGKVILMTDADVDGAHIRTLLLTLFFRYMRPLVEAGRVFAAVPPLHRVLVSGGRGSSGGPEAVYTYSERELNALLAKLERQGRKYSQPVQRYKGLGEMDADQLAQTTMDPRGRTLRRVTMTDAAAAEQTFELLMGTEVGPRRDFLIEGAAGLDRELIDA